MDGGERVLEELAALEPVFHRPQPGTDRAAVEAMVAEDCEGFRCEQLAPDTFLLTYTLVRPRGRSRRMTIWQRAADGRWRARYHQGTPAPPNP